ncbi:MAG: DNA-3-methyladenine glycosylase [Haloarculaceae archaeon]
METGSLSLADVPGGFDLQATVESAQSFRWSRADGDAYGAATAHGGDAWYHTVADGDVVWVRQVDDRLAWRATGDVADLLVERFRLGDDLDAVFASFPTDEPLATARAAPPGLRVVSDPFFPTLVSFICSARLTVGRIHALVNALAEAFGDAVEADGATYHAFPRPAQLAAASEAALRDLGLGFRAPYVAETAAMVADGDVSRTALDGGYESARGELQRFPGVGPKVADCVALFGLGYLAAVPIDTWTRRILERHYPDLARDGYQTTGDAVREYFGPRAGYAQTYLYHYFRE